MEIDLLWLIPILVGVAGLIYNIQKDKSKLDLQIVVTYREEGNFEFRYHIDLVGDKPILVDMWGVYAKNGKQHKFPPKHGWPLKFEPGGYRHRELLMRKSEMDQLNDVQGKKINYFEYAFIRNGAGKIIKKKIKF